MYQRLFNFSAGPAVLPVSVLEKVRDEMMNYQGAGMSVMEMSHRSKAFEEILAKTEASVRSILGLSDDYAVLFLQGGASLQFSMVPMNLYTPGKPVDVVHTGVWSGKAIDELKKSTEFNIIASSEDKNFTYIPDVAASQFNPDASYAYCTSNNTIYGTRWTQFPQTGSVPLVCDMSSDIFSRPFDMNQFGLVFAGAQKNLGPSGVTLVIIRKDLAERASSTLPTMLQYRTHIKNTSMYNTPPAFGIYVLGLVLDWIKEQGGLKGMEQKNNEKAGILYNTIDNSDFYYCPNVVKDRSTMNVVFRINGNNEDLEKTFLKEAAQNGLLELKGHRSVGGLRASIYNAQTLDAVKSLSVFMKDFAKKHA